MLQELTLIVVVLLQKSSISTEASPDPWLVSIINKDGSELMFCDGVLINLESALTSCSCTVNLEAMFPELEPLDPNQMEVTAGFAKTAQTRMVQKLRKHPLCSTDNFMEMLFNYDYALAVFIPFTPAADIAAVRWLSDPDEMTEIYQTNELQRQQCSSSLWTGKKLKSNRGIPNLLNVKILSHSICQEQFCKKVNGTCDKDFLESGFGCTEVVEGLSNPTQNCSLTIRPGSAIVCENLLHGIVSVPPDLCAKEKTTYIIISRIESIVEYYVFANNGIQTSNLNPIKYLIPFLLKLFLSYFFILLIS